MIQINASATLILIVILAIASSSARPTDPYESLPHHQSDHDASSERERSFIPYLKSAHHEQLDRFRYDSWLSEMSPRRDPNAGSSTDWASDWSLYTPSHQEKVVDADAGYNDDPSPSLAKQMPLLNVEDTNDAIEDDHYEVQGEEDPSEENSSQLEMTNMARLEFQSIVKEMGIKMRPDSIRRRFREFACQKLRNDLLSNDDVRKWKATASILMHRPHVPGSSRNVWNQETINEEIYKHYTMDDVLDQIFDIMGVAPTEDMRTWWYDRIKMHAQVGVIPVLFTGDQHQREAAAAQISGLTRRGHIWIKERRKRVPSHRS